MRVALVNPPWSFEGSIYFGCRDPHLPLEYGYARALLERAGHEVELVDAQLEGLSHLEIRARVGRISPELTVVTTAPSYLFWRCAPPELRVPQQTVDALRSVGGALVAVGPHASTTPRATVRKLGVDLAIQGECEEALVEVASTPRGRWGEIDGVAWADGEEVHVHGGPRGADMQRLPPLGWEPRLLARHAHHHHRFERAPDGPGAEVEASRGCPYRCSFCAKDNFRDKFRKRPLETVLAEIDGLVEMGVRYVYFVDEIFLPDRALLEALVSRDVAFGVQLRIDNWSRETLDLLGRAGCVSIEAGVESITREGRSLLAKHCRMSTEELTELLVCAKQSVPFVQANLLECKTDSPEAIRAWRAGLERHGVWANDPVPMFLYPGSPGYTARWGAPDDLAWERAHDNYLNEYDRFSDIQDTRPVPLAELELARPSAGGPRG